MSEVVKMTTGETLYACNKIDYFSKEEYSPDPNDSTMAIPYTVTRSVIFFLAASLLLCSGYCCCILGQCVRHRSLYTFISGVIFIVTGLVMLFGLIMYISIFKAEIGSKLRPRSQLQPPAFYYWYGYSFLLYVSGLVTTQLAGISSIFLFIYKVQYEWQRKHLEDIKRGKSRHTTFSHYDTSMFYPCRRHPQAYINSNSAIHFPASYPTPFAHQKRYFFSKEPLQESPCSVHRPRSHSNSLKDVSNFYDFPPPPTISYQFDEHFGSPVGREPPIAGRHFPRDITTNTVSTTADVNCDEFIGEPYEDYSPSIQHEFVTFDLDQPLPLRAQSSVSIGSRNGTARKTFDSDTLRRTTPV
ncbi:voltage-dependent calcium channel gamma-5 subunit [Tribolium madens]|uniref:voltage-dependent calcium channel gamma-5 subunit n=1 Tax=Tribolium madens TaxID=41895 RepID=UPI001CF76012|nr:voltage-dependent calcium channel gamma-5 subunit [Tribolium madens]